MFINVNGKEEKSGTSFINMDEAKIVAKLVGLIEKEYGINSKEIGVITPYA